MSDRLVVNLESLGSTATNLKSLADAFNSSNDDADAVKPYLGSGELADAVHDFAHDWKDKKQKLVGQLDDLQKMAEEAHNGYCTTDVKLADGLRKSAS